MRKNKTVKSPNTQIEPKTNIEVQQYHAEQNKRNKDTNNT